MYVRETCGAGIELSGNATRFRFCPAIKRPWNVLRLNVLNGDPWFIRVSSQRMSWKGARRWGAILLLVPSFIEPRAFYQVLPVALSYSVVALPWHRPKPSARSHHHGSQRVVWFKTSHSPNSPPSCALFLVGLQVNYRTIDSTIQEKTGIARAGTPTVFPSWAFVALWFPGYCITSYGNLPTAPYRVGATVRVAD